MLKLLSWAISCLRGSVYSLSPLFRPVKGTELIYRERHTFARLSVRTFVYCVDWARCLHRPMETLGYLGASINVVSAIHADLLSALSAPA